jgi:hypothetical protein
VLCALSALVLAHGVPARASAPEADVPAAVASDVPSIDVREGGWGSADPDEIRKVLQSVADALMAYFPHRRLEPIIVRHTTEYPVVVYERGPRNEYQVYLTAADRGWGQYVYQFAHELTHILTNYEHRQTARAENRNQWFEETLCEVASLWALRHLASEWGTSPPSRQLAGFGPELLAYANAFLSQPHRMLPAGVSAADFMRQHEAMLRRDPYLRQHNELVANLLLPMFEHEPRIWEAVGYLNLTGTGDDFGQYVSLWYADAPVGDKDAIRHVMRVLGIEPSTGDSRRPS